MLADNHNVMIAPLSDYLIPNIIIKAALPTLNSLNVCHINIRSLFGKVDALRDSLRGSGVHVILVSETWLTTDISDSMVHFPGYKLFRRDRNSSTRGGGVAMYVKCGISVSVLKLSEPGDNVEFIFAKVRCKHQNILLSCVYLPNPSQHNLAPLKHALEDLSPQYEHSLIGGDFNINILAAQNSVKRVSSA